jgi:hypothetical protein
MTTTARIPVAASGVRRACSPGTERARSTRSERPVVSAGRGTARVGRGGAGVAALT